MNSKNIYFSIICTYVLHLGWRCGRRAAHRVSSDTMTVEGKVLLFETTRCACSHFGLGSKTACHWLECMVRRGWIKSNVPEENIKCPLYSYVMFQVLTPPPTLLSFMNEDLPFKMATSLIAAFVWPWHFWICAQENRFYIGAKLN